METEKAESETKVVVEYIQQFLNGRDLDEKFLTVIGQLDNKNDPEDDSERYHIEYIFIPGNSSGKKDNFQLNYEDWTKAVNHYSHQVKTIEDTFEDARTLLSSPETYTDSGIGGGNLKL